MRKLYCNLTLHLPHHPIDFSLSFTDYTVISFDSFVANTGDIEGRAAIRNDFTVGNGFSVGQLIPTSSLSANPVTFVIGRDGTWGSGALLPSSSEMYVGDVLTAPSYLSDYVYNTPCPGCTDSYFDAAQNCYRGQGSYFSSQPTNCVGAITPYTGGQFTLVCSGDYTTTQYYLQVDASILSQAHSYGLDDSCNWDANYVITVTGTSDLTLQGNYFPGVNGDVIYNVPGSRTVYVSGRVNGGIIAPDATITVVQNAQGTIDGKVVAADISLLTQFNMPCEIRETPSK